MHKLVLFLFLIASHFSVADNHSGPKYGALDMYACSFDKGKDMEDLKSLYGDYGEWAEENSAPDSLSYTLTPFIADLGNYDFDFVWMDRYGSYEDLGKGIKLWAENSGKFGDKMSKVITCDSQWMMTGFAVSPIKEAGDDSAALMLISCAFSDGQGWSDLAAADQKWISHLNSEGIEIEGGLYRWIPGAGWPDDNESDYVNVYVADDIVAYGRTIDKMWGGLGGIYNKIYGEIAQCDNPGIWGASAIADNS